MIKLDRASGELPSGAADDQAFKDEAERLVREAPGAASVRNELIVPRSAMGPWSGATTGRRTSMTRIAFVGAGRKRSGGLVAMLFVWFAWPGFANADVIEQTGKHAVRVNVLARGLEHPWSLAFLPDGRMLVTERRGRLRYVAADGTLDPTPIAGLPEAVAEAGQGGLHDVALHPEFPRNRLVYLAYAGKGDGGYGTELARGRLDGHRLAGVEVLFRALPKSRGGRHFGGRIVFDGAGHVFLTLGDRGERPRAQDLGDHAGSVIRLTEDGGIPADNPYVSAEGARPEIFTLGNRNVQGAAIHPRTGELWTHEHGPQGGDEVNVIRAGANYGWPVVTYGRNYGFGTKIGEGTHKEGMAPPLHQWTPSIAPSGMAFYEGDKFPVWRGSLLVGALKFRLLARLEFDGERFLREEWMLEDVIGRIRDVRVGPDGYVWLLSDEPDGVIARLEPAGD